MLSHKPLRYNGIVKKRVEKPALFFAEKEAARMVSADDVLRVAVGEVGYREGPNNKNKYGETYGTNNVSWCCQFVWWVFREAGASELFGRKTASCTNLYQQHTAQEVAKKDLRRGDVVFFDWSGGSECEHVGIVDSWQDGKLITIEGNTGEGNQSNGDGVYAKLRPLSVVSHNFQPAYSGTAKDLITVELPLLKYGSVGYEVKTLQRLLMSYGYSMSPYGVDGEFGSLTERRVKEFQKKRGLDQDGEVGKDTWTSLLTG